MDVLLGTVRGDIEEPAHDDDGSIGEWGSEPESVNLNQVANPVDFNGSPVIVNKNCSDCSACACKSGFSVELIIKFVSVGVPSQEVELGDGLGEVPGQVCHGRVELIRSNPPMCVDRKGDPVGEVGPTWEAFWSFSPTMVATSVNGRSRLNDQEITIGNVEWSSRTWPVVVTANGVVAVSSSDAGVMWDLLGTAATRTQTSVWSFWKTTSASLGWLRSLTVKRGPGAILGRANGSGTRVGVSTKVGGKLLLEVRSRDDGVKLDGKHAR